MSTKTKNIQNSKEVDPSQYINMSTGECLSEELSGCTINKDSGYVLLSSDDYAVVDSNAVAFLKNKLNRSEFGSCILMTQDLKTPFNIVFNNTVPHSNETLQTMLGIESRSTFSILIRKLISLGVLYQVKGNIMGKVRVIYMMNPFLARKRKVLDNNVIEIFSKFK